MQDQSFIVVTHKYVFWKYLVDTRSEMMLG